MSIKQHFESALRGIEAEKERAIAASREKATKEKIVPNNAALDESKNKALNALTEKHNHEIAKLQEAFNTERTAIITASEKAKSDFASATLEAEATLVAVQYDNAIHALQKQISDIKE